MENIIFSSDKTQDDLGSNLFVPTKFEQYIGQEKIKEKLELFVKAAKKRQENLDHVLLFGPPGLGKTTLSKIIAQEIGSNLKITSAPAISKVGDLVGILSGLEKNDIFFIDEIHRLPKIVEEALYSAMENFYVDIVVGQGAGAKSVQLPLNPFTLIGATTKTALLSAPLQTRFGIIERLDFYNPDELAKIVEKNAEKLDIKICSKSSFEVGSRSRGTPRIAKRIIRRIRDFCQVHEKNEIDLKTALQALEFLNIDSLGLDSLDRKILIHIYKDFNGGPVGLETLAAISGEDKETIEDFCEPFLIRCGLLEKTPRGRAIPRNKIIEITSQDKIEIKDLEINKRII